MSTVIVKEEGELENVAHTLIDALPLNAHASVLALTGDLGAGKTALTKAIGRVFGIREHITSPTFVIMKSYAISHHERFSTLTHIDAYRIESDDELRVIGFSELLRESKQLVVIEWPERVHNVVPEYALAVSIDIGGNGERIITYDD
jgi:tRNA threonylcarbamoyladenosine biosynthesis protein TsaE